MATKDSSMFVDVLAGAAAGGSAGLVVALLEGPQGIVSAALLGLTPGTIALGPYVLFATLVGAAFGAVFRYRRGAYAATAAGGVLTGLLWWVVWSLTLAPLADGSGPTWSLAEASTAFPYLIGDLLYGGLTGLGLSLLAALGRRIWPRSRAVARERPVRVVILGGGFGGVAAAQRLERVRGVEVTVVSPSNSLLFTPMLAEVASGALEPQHVSAPVRAACPLARFYRASAESADFEARTVTVRGGSTAPAETIPYDHLVVALGSVPSFLGLPGMAEHALTLKTLADATLLRSRVIGLLERADSEQDPALRRQHLTFVVVGGGFGGVEIVAELQELVRSVRRFYPNVGRRDPRFVLVHGGGRILPELDRRLGEYALRILRDRGVDVYLSCRVAGARAGAVLLAGGRRIPAGTVVWTAGNRPHPLVAGLACDRDRRGAVVVDATLRARGVAGVWAIGDCAAVPVAGQANNYPPTAQHALREGRAVADNIAAVVRGRQPRPFRYRTAGRLCSLGRRQAAAQIGGLLFSGLVAWAIWRSVYWAKLPGLEKKARVLLDWAVELLFPRDIALAETDAASVHELPRAAEAAGR